MKDIGYYLVLNPSYGYLNQEGEYKSFNIEDAALFTSKNLEQYDIERNNTPFVLTELTTEQIQNMPFDLPRPTYSNNFDDIIKMTEADELADDLTIGLDAISKQNIQL